jgi:hypothetical protein
MISSAHFNHESPVQFEVVTDAGELARSRKQDEQFDRNSDWLESHAAEVYPQCRGRHVCVAGQELFVASTAEQALDLAQAAHPDDEGILLRYIPCKKVTRIYAH